MASSRITVVPVPVLSDNYAYLIVDKEKRVAAAVDPAQPAKLLSAASEQGVSITTVLTTHKHLDHSGGNEEMATIVPNLTVVGGVNDSIPAVTKTVTHGDKLDFAGTEVRVLSTPCHTQGHVCYYLDGHVFTGDTLFIGGCGRFFEGSATEMHKALVEVLGSLPSETKVWCGHEYTRKNLEFCASIEPENPAVKAKRDWANATEQTIPSTIGDEKSFNVFMRVAAPELQAAIGITEPVAAMAELRKRKDCF
eukprot:CAMPEP_0198326066 /NCGR_PEP_ID=MMETSP1450-20131203/13678_1 /TAXON_ID=753684 ORGANISM="Madagascaria erythrocladiodes, Strain CCMP3234" /NCGR_SAMPLE_ID=MMETSP1450 /ASSEMBLY_ACC=CAM_ASM_001115 /LENGTH=250 /DNA_ID=CAMNT_0044030003 /DNA_START=64 /DNA_END=816 /DNA_ORIENTATION=-